MVTSFNSSTAFRTFSALAAGLFCVLFSIPAHAQPKQNSPYSRYGIGDLYPQYFAAQQAFGGQTAAFHDPYHLNLSNPAAYAHLRSAALETGLYAKFSQYQSTTSSLNAWTGNLAYLALGFTLKSPINQALDRTQSPWQFGMGFALTPYSQVGYNVEAQETLPDLGLVVNLFEGSGGTYRLNWGNGVKYKNTALGVELGWLFGKATYENTTTFADSFPTYRNHFRDDIRINGLNWSIGAQHDFVLRRSERNRDVPIEWITLGLTAKNSQSVSINSEKIYLRSRGRLDNGAYLTPDTLLGPLKQDLSLTLPAAFSVGLQYVNADKLKLGAQVDYGHWEGYRNEARPERFRNTLGVSAGVEYIPDYASYNRFVKRVRYRLGGYYRQDPRTVNGVDINDIGITFGFGLPVLLPRQQVSFVNTAFEIGRLGDGSPIEETYYRITVGFTLNDNSWFYKRRFE